MSIITSHDVCFNTRNVKFLKDMQFCCVSLQKMCSLQCSSHEVIKGEQTRVVFDSRVTQQVQANAFNRCLRFIPIETKMAQVKEFLGTL